MAPAIYLFLSYLIPLLYGQLDAVSPVTKTVTSTPSTSSQLNHAATPSMKMNQPSSSKHTFSGLQSSPIPSDQVKSLIQSFIVQSTTSLKPSQAVLNTIVNQTNNFSTAGALPTPSIKQSITLTLKDSGIYSSSQPIIVQPSKQQTSQLSGSVIIADSGQLLTATTTPEVTSATIPQQKSSLIVKTTSPPNILITRTVTTSTKSKLSVSVRNNNYSTQILVSASPALETPSNNISRSSSISKVMPGLTSSPNGILIPTVSKVKPNLTSSSSNVKLRSSNVIPSPTSSKMKLKQTSSTNVVPNLSSSNVKLNLSSSTMVIPHPSSVQHMPNISSTLAINVTSSPVIIVNPTSASKVMLTATSAPFALNSSRVVKSIMSSPLSNQSVRSTVFPTSAVLPYNHSSFTVTIEPSCNNLLTCSITLQPSATMQYKSMSGGTTLSSSLSNIRNASTFMSSSVSGMNTSSVLHPNKPTKGSQDKEETHTSLIIGLAVGLSLGMVLIIVIIVYYRRKRSSYQYNVFYDEQNIVMHPFDYSK